MSTTPATDAVASPRFQPTRPDHLIAYGFGAGLSPMAPGTIGTLVAIPIYLVLANLPGLVYLVAVAILIGAGIWACNQVIAETGEDDPPSIVWDEVVGFLVAMAAAPVVSLAWILMGFLLFRLFDIFKPWPARRVERWGGGWGVMADDVFAGVCAAIALRLLLLLLERLPLGGGF